MVIHTNNLLHDFTTKEYQVLSKGNYKEYIHKKKKIHCSQRIYNLYSILILNTRFEKSELKRAIHVGIPLEYEVTDFDE